MAWWERFVGKPTMEDVAQQVMQRLRAHGLTAIRFDPEQSEIYVERDGAMTALFLGNLLREYQRVVRKERPALIERFLSGLLSDNSGDQLPTTYEAARGRVLPVVRTDAIASIAFLSTLRFESANTNAEENRLAVHPLVGNYVIGLVYDSPNAMHNLSYKHLSDWQVSFEQVLQEALQNLRSLPEHGGWQQSNGLWEATWGDGYESSRVLLPDLIYRTGVPDPVALMPLRNSLLLCSARDEQALNAMAQRAKQLIEEQPRWLSLFPIQLLDGNWRSFAPPASCEALFRDLAFHDIADAHQSQKQLLEDLHQRTGKDIFVADLKFYERDNVVRSYAVWGQDVDTLLPVSDMIAFHKRDDSQQGADVLIVPRDQALQVVGTLLEPTDLAPTRHRVRHFPSEQQWSQLQRIAGA